MSSKQAQVLIIGAGPSGSISSALLHKQGIKTIVIEKQKFPRFVIGESLLPFCTEVLKEAGFLDAVEAHGFQYKNGAAFSHNEEYRYFDFCDKSSSGSGTTFQVQRGDFDKVLIDCAIKQGVEVLFEVQVEDISFDNDGAVAKLSNGETISAKFVLDASGYGRVLPRILNLESPSNLSAKKAYFTHIQDNITEVLYDRNKILITTHPRFRDVWFWLIPFSNGRASIGVVGEPQRLEIEGTNDELEILQSHTYQAPMLKRLLGNAKWDTPARSISSYSKDVKTLFGDRFMLLGNASEFLDPVFSSGVSIAMQSARLASNLVPKILKGQKVDLQTQYADELMIGINCFRAYVEGWYSGVFQDIIYAKNPNHHIKRQICSILAGYAWDKINPFVTKPKEALNALEGYCKA